MKYETQKLALLYFWGAMILFLAQVTFGVLAGSIYVFPNLLSETLPFHVLRMIHTNALLVWLLLGFFGATYYLIPEEAERDIESPFIAKLQFWIFFIAAAVAVIGYLFRIHEGREFLEQPLYVKIAIVVAALLFLYNVSLTVLRGRKTVISTILLIGLWGIALFFLFAFYNPGNLSVDKLYWWWVVHLWVEAVWELVMASILAFLMIKLTGVDREVIEKWLYVIVGLALFSGLLGTGHHYYWIGAPGYWHWVGSIFSTFEVLPFFAMVLFAFYMVYLGGRDHPNKAALLWALGRHGHVLLRRRRLGLHAHAASDQLLLARHADHRRARSSGVLRRLRDDQSGDHHLCLPEPARSAAVQPDPQHVELLGDDLGDGVHDLHADLRRRGAEPPAAGARHGLHGDPGPAAVLLLATAGRRRRRDAFSLPVRRTRSWRRSANGRRSCSRRSKSGPR